MARLSVIVIFLCLGTLACFAQDSVKKKAPVKTPPKYTYKRRSYKYYAKKADSVAHAPVEPGLVRPDTRPVVRAPSFTDKTLNGQYQYLLSKVYHYQQPLISALWKNASDTLSANRAKLNSAMSQIKTQNKVLDSLKSELNSDGDALNTSNERRDGMDVFGLILPKTTYNLIVWGLIILLGVITVLVISRSAIYRREAHYRTQLYTELEEEHKAFKAKANDKEKKLARELQTERNKLDELLGRG